MRRVHKFSLFGLMAAVLLLVCASTGCHKPSDYRGQADDAATKIIQAKQQEVLGRSEPFTIEQPADTLRRRILLASGLPYSSEASLGTDQLPTIKHWPEQDYPGPTQESECPVAPWNAEQPLQLTLMEALQVAARNNRDYQRQKEEVFLAALDLDLERDDFRNTFAGALESFYSADLSGDHTEGGITNSIEANISRQLKSGALLTGRIAVDLVNLLTLDRASSFGIFADATISIPLLRGSGKHIVAEPLTQAERNVVYAIHSFERYKGTLAVNVASGYLAVLGQQDRVANAKSNYESLLAATREATWRAKAEKLRSIQVDQAKQDELRARDRWISAQQSYARQLDSFKITLGLPPDANIELDRAELQRLAELSGKTLAVSVAEETSSQSASSEESIPQADDPVDLVPPTREGGGPLEFEPAEAVGLALENRLDLRTSLGRVYDAQRAVVVAADNLRADLTLAATGQAGESRSISSAGSANAQLRPEKGYYTAGLLLDLPLERTSERNAYRESYISLERAVRSVQELEDEIKLDVRNDLRNLLQARESTKIQAQAVKVAQRRVASTKMFLEAEREGVQIRDILEAEESLVSAQNDLTSALVNYRVAELELQLDMDVLQVSEKGLWREYNSKNESPE